MITITLKGDTTAGEKICSALAGCKAFVDNDIVVNYTDSPGTVCILLGDPSDKDVRLKEELDE